MITDSRLTMLDVAFHAEISLRQNRPMLVEEILKVMPGILDAQPVIHPVVSHAYYSRAMRCEFMVQPDKPATTLGEKHKLQALKGM